MLRFPDVARAAILVVAAGCGDDRTDTSVPDFVADDAQRVALGGFVIVEGAAAEPAALGRFVGDELWVQLGWGVVANDGAPHGLELVARFPRGPAGLGDRCAGHMVIGRVSSSADRLDAATADFTEVAHTSCLQVRSFGIRFELSLRLETTLDLVVGWHATEVPVEVAVNVVIEGDIESRSAYHGECEGLSELYPQLSPIYLPAMLFDRSDHLDWPNLPRVEGDCRRQGCYLTGAGQCGDGDRALCRVCHDDVCLHPAFQSECYPW